MCNAWCIELTSGLLDHFPRNVSIVEVGSRNVNGSVRAVLEPYANQYVGVDLFEGEGVDVILDVAGLRDNFRDDSVDVVISTEMLEHCFNWQDALYQMASIVCEDGLLLITTRSPGFELHDYPSDHWRFSYIDFERIFARIGEVIAVESDMTLGWACGVGVLVRKKIGQTQLREWKSWLDSFPVYSMANESKSAQQDKKDLLESVLFDQYSRYKACADLLRQASFVPGDSVLDIGSGPECLFGGFLPEATLTYVDPLIPSGSGHGRISGNIFASELDGKQFDCVAAVDVLEHVPSENRQVFLERFASLAKRTLILGFPTSESSAPQTDEAIDAQYRAIFGRNYSWLEEHYRFGLPSLAETVEQLTRLGWHCQTVGHGHAPWLKELLGFVVCAWDIPSLHDVVVEISEKFNRELYVADFRPPYYRQFVIASRSPLPPIAPPSGTISHADADCAFRSLVEEAYRLYFAASVRHLADRDKEIMRLNAKIEEVSAWSTSVSVSLAERDSRIAQITTSVAEVSTWAIGLNATVAERDTEIVRLNATVAERDAEIVRLNATPLQKFTAGISRVTAAARRRISSTIVGDTLRYARDKRRYQKTRVEFETVRESIAANGGNLIVTFPIITWDFRWQRPQHIVTRLRNKGYAVLYVAMSLTALGRKVRSRNEAGALLGFNDLDRHVQQIWLHSAGSINVYNDAIEGDDLHNLVSGLDAAIVELKPKSIQYLLQFPGWWPIAEKLREKHGGKVIFDCMDDHSGFSTNSVKALQTEEHLIERADLVITSSNLLEDKVRALNPRTVQVKNGTEFEHFSAPKPNGELDHLLGRPIIGYYGAISDWFDMDIVAHCAKAHPDWHFVLIGSTHGADLRSIERLSNVYLLGEKKYAELPGYLAYFHVCTIPFKLIPLTLATNPVKFYEYLSAGKPVVSVALPELFPYSEDCYLAKDALEFDALLKQALDERNDSEKMARRTMLAKANSWDSRADAIVDAMKIF